MAGSRNVALPGRRCGTAAWRRFVRRASLDALDLVAAPWAHRRTVRPEHRLAEPKRQTSPVGHAASSDALQRAASIAPCTPVLDHRPHFQVEVIPSRPNMTDLPPATGWPMTYKKIQVERYRTPLKCFLTAGLPARSCGRYGWRWGHHRPRGAWIRLFTADRRWRSIGPPCG